MLAGVDKHNFLAAAVRERTYARLLPPPSPFTPFFPDHYTDPVLYLSKQSSNRASSGCASLPPLPPLPVIKHKPRDHSSPCHSPFTHIPLPFPSLTPLYARSSSCGLHPPPHPPLPLPSLPSPSALLVSFSLPLLFAYIELLMFSRRSH